MNLPTNAVKGIITNEKGEILLLQRNPNKYGGDVWDLPGGLMDQEENEKDTLIREVKEELNVDIKILGKKNKWKFIRLGDKKTVEVQNYICEIIGGNIELSSEHKDYKWVSLKDMQKYEVKDKSLYESLKNI